MTGPPLWTHEEEPWTVSEGDLTLGGLIAAIALVVVTLLGTILGGMAGMRLHRKVDKTGIGTWAPRQQRIRRQR